MGTHAGIRQGNTTYALIVELETQAAFGAIHRLRAIILTIMILSGLGVLAVTATLARTIAGPVRELSQRMLMVAKDRFGHDMDVIAKNEIGELAAAFGSMVLHLKAVKSENDTQSRCIAGLVSLHRLIGGEQEIGQLGLNTLEFLSGFLALGQTDLFIAADDGGLTSTSRFPGHPNQAPQQVCNPGDGRVGQAALDKHRAAFRKDALSGLMTSVPSTDPANRVAVPLVLRQTVIGVLELEAANAQMVKNHADLEVHMHILKTQQVDMQIQNTDLEQTHRELAEKARQLEVSSRYKTEFMANMSHELRTPLNSILLLSRLLLENKEKTLTPKQSEFSRTIHSAGEDLLNLINEILDLAKAESGKMAVARQAVCVQSIANAMQVGFAPLSENAASYLPLMFHRTYPSDC